MHACIPTSLNFLPSDAFIGRLRKGRRPILIGIAESNGMTNAGLAYWHIFRTPSQLPDA